MWLYFKIIIYFIIVILLTIFLHERNIYNNWEFEFQISPYPGNKIMKALVYEAGFVCKPVI